MVLAKPVFSSEIYTQFFGLTQPEEIAFAEEVAQALRQLDPNFIPSIEKTPLDQRQPNNLHHLLGLYTNAQNLNEKKAILESVAQVYLQGGITQESIAALKSLLAQAQDSEELGLLAKCIALSGDVHFMQLQMARLQENDPLLSASAARLLGYGAYQAAVPLLCTMLNPIRFIESVHVIWALGEIGDTRALPVLEGALKSGFRSIECLDALGKIGALTSIASITPFLMQGYLPQQEAAYRALAAILDHNRDHQEAIKTLKGTLLPIIQHSLEENDPACTTRHVYALLCSARLGEKIKPAKLRQLLRAKLPLQEMQGLGNFFFQYKSKLSAPL